MTEKEKAKAYDEALERVKKLYGKGITEEIFPELKEDDNEKIRKEITSILRNAYWTSNKNRFDELVAWLEKHGKEEYGLKSFKDEDVRKFMQYIEKQAKAYEFNLPNRSYDIYAFAKDLLVWIEKQYTPHTEKNEPKFKVGDWIVTHKNKVLQITSIEGTSYRFNNESHYWPICYCDEECRLWTIEDAKDGDILACKEEILLFKSYSVQERISLYCWYNGHTNNFHSKEMIDTLLTKGNKVCPATKEQRDALMKAMNYAGYKWDAETKTLEKLEKSSFHKGDWVVNKFGDSWHIDSLDKKNYQVSDGKGNYNYFPISKQDEMHLWTIQDAKDGDIICYRDEISLYKNEIENCNKQDTTFGGFVYYCCYDGKRFITNSFYLLTGQDEIDIYPATKEQRDLLFQKMKEAGYEWDTKKKELKKKRKR